LQIRGAPRQGRERQFLRDNPVLELLFRNEGRQEHVLQTHERGDVGLLEEPDIVEGDYS
jgi:hypothetical protein